MFAVPFDLAAAEGDRRPDADRGRRPVVWRETTGASHSASRAPAPSSISLASPHRRGRWEIDAGRPEGNVERLKLPPAGTFLRRASLRTARASPSEPMTAKRHHLYLSPVGASAMQRITFGGNNRFPIWSDSHASHFSRIARATSPSGDNPSSAALPNGSRSLRPGESHAPESWHPKGRSPAVQRDEGTDTRCGRSRFRTGRRRRSVTSTRCIQQAHDSIRVADGWRIRAGTRRRRRSTSSHFQPATGMNSTSRAPAPPPTRWPGHRMKELFYVPRILEFEAVSITTEPAFAFGNAVKVPRPFGPGAPNREPCSTSLRRGSSWPFSHLARRTVPCGAHRRLSSSSIGWKS